MTTAVPSAIGSSVQLRNVKRSGLIRPSSGYYSNIKRTDTGLESGKCSSSNVNIVKPKIFQCKFLIINK